MLFLFSARFSGKYFGGDLGWFITAIDDVTELEGTSGSFWAFFKGEGDDMCLLPVGECNCLVCVTVFVEASLLVKLTHRFLA